MQNRLVDYVDGKSQSQTYFKSFSTLQKCLLISMIYHGSTHGMFYVYWIFPLVENMALGQFKARGHEFESLSGSSTFHIYLTWALLVHMPALGHQILRGKRKWLVASIQVPSRAGTVRGASVYLIWAGQGGSPNYR